MHFMLQLIKIKISISSVYIKDTMQPSVKYGNQILSSVIACLSVLCVGCSVGWTTPTLKKLEQKNSTIPLTQDEGSWMAAIHETGHFLSPLPTAFLISKFGRKTCLLISCFINVLGWIVLLFAKAVLPLYFSRFLFGLSMGIVFTTVPLYIAEVASSNIRGSLSTCFQAMLYLGHLIEFSVGPYVTFDVLNYISFSISFVAFFSLFFFLMESPLYLISKDEYVKAKYVLRYLYKTSDSDKISAETEKIENMIAEREGFTSKYTDLFTPLYRKKLLIVIMTAIAQRFTGMSAIVAYAESTFSSTEGCLSSEEYTILFGTLIFLFTFVSAGLIDNLGRRPLLLISCCGCSVTHIITSMYFYSGTKLYTVIPFLMISAFSIFYSLGLGPLVNTLQGELFPPHVKGLASSLVTISHATSSFAVTKLFQVIRDSIGIYVAFFVFGICCMISFIFGWFYVPETKKKELGELQQPEGME